MKILGTHFYGHDSAVFQIDTEKKEIFAISTERVTRIKHDDLDIEPILQKYDLSDSDYVCHGYSNFDESVPGDLRLYRIVRLHRQKALRRLIEPKYIKDLNISKYEKLKKVFGSIMRRPVGTFKDLYILSSAYEKRFYNKHKRYSLRKNFEEYFQDVLCRNGVEPKKIDFFDHHLCHAVGAYYLSPYAYRHKALSLTIDLSGDGYFSKLFIFDGDRYEYISGSKIEPFKSDKPEHRFHFSSIGMLYGNFTEALGLRRFSDEGKVEALAAFGTRDEELYRRLSEATEITADSISYDVKALEPFYEIDRLKKEVERVGREAFAATIQSYLEDTVVNYLNLVADKTDAEYLCLSGGVAANIIMSLNIYERTRFKHIFVVPPMGDEGIAAGAALLKAKELGEDISWVNRHYMPYYGNEVSKDEIEDAIVSFKDKISAEEIGEEWKKDAAKSIAEKKIIAIVNGRMEFGPRALGNRSILANPTDPEIRKRINMTVKRRPAYQPFCPSILEEERERLFERSFPHKHMAIAFRVKKEFQNEIPAAIHVDGTARPQFVEREDNPDYYELISEVKKLTGYGVVINTSFNLHGRTIVHTAKDAILDFIDCNIDVLYMGGYKITRKS